MEQVEEMAANMNNFKLSVSSYRKKLIQEGKSNVEELVQKYANEKHEFLSGKTNKDIQYQKEVLGRMIESGCRACERRRQEAYIKRLENETN